MKKKRVTEAHAYHFIYDELIKKKGWLKNQVHTQNECRNVKAVSDALGLETPESVVQISEDTYYVIEAKRERSMLEQAVKEARAYADKINKLKKVKCLFVSGIAGNYEEGFIARSQYLEGSTWKDISENEHVLTSLLSKLQTDEVLRQKRADLKEVEISEEEFFKAAEDINNILHRNAVQKDARAKLVAALLLAIAEGSQINLNVSSSILINSINKRAQLVLRKEGKGNFSRFVRIDEPSNEDNHFKLKRAIVLTLQELESLNIRSAMRSGKDILGDFYEAFLKYGNGAKEIGIVLTPRHITRFVAQVLDVTADDLVLDPACGTGGFLVAAFDEVRKTAKTKQFERFKRYGLYGIEQQDHVVILALVNMIFRGDGKNNIIEGNCFNKWLTSEDDGASFVTSDSSQRIPPISKVMMNPPFAQDDGDEPEFRFVEHALQQMGEGGVLFSILPISVMIKAGKELEFRKRLLLSNTLLSVITFPGDLFYPTSANTVGIFIQKGIPHPKRKKVLWIKTEADGFVKKKKKRIFNKQAKNDFPQIQGILRAHLNGSSTKIKNIPEFQKSCPINYTDENLELIPEAYLDNHPKSQKQLEGDLEKLMRELVIFNIRHKEMLERGPRETE